MCTREWCTARCYGAGTARERRMAWSTPSQRIQITVGEHIHLETARETSFHCRDLSWAAQIVQSIARFREVHIMERPWIEMDGKMEQMNIFTEEVTNVPNTDLHGVD